MSSFAGHTGEMRSPRNLGEPVLILDQGRSVLAAWPDDAVCETCGAGKERTGGYVGPVEGDEVHYPNAALRFTCKPCARTAAQLGELELTGHTCYFCANDVEHVDRPFFRTGELEGKGEDERIEYVSTANEYPKRGWTVLAVERAPERAPVGVYWYVHIRATRDLPRESGRW